MKQPGTGTRGSWETACAIPRDEFQTVCWREGSRGEQSSRFAAVRVQTAERHVQRAPPSEEVWLDHFEGRTWRGFHHHATLCMVAHGFLALRRARFPRRRTRWTLLEVRRRLQHLLLRRIGHCPLCLRHIGARAPPRGPSRI